MHLLWQFFVCCRFSLCGQGLIKKHLSVGKMNKTNTLKIADFLTFTDCPSSMDVDLLVPEEIKDIATCVLADNCFGIICCVEYSFIIPLSSILKTISVLAWFKMDPCEFSFNTGIGDYQHQEQLLHYDWGLWLFLNPFPHTTNLQQVTF